MAIDWTSGMSQTFEYYLVDPNTWADSKRLDNVISSSITRDADSETLESASFEINDEIGEAYIRTYLVCNQNGMPYKFALGTHLVQTPSFSFDGKIKKNNLNAYSVLTELKENPTDIGYSIVKGSSSNIMDLAYNLVVDKSRAKCEKVTGTKTLTENYVAETDDTWLTYISSLISKENYYFGIDPYGKIFFTKKYDAKEMQPKWTFTDDNSSILLPDISIERDLYGIPNVVEVIYSSASSYIYKKVENTDATSPVSIQNRGRKITYRSTNPSFPGEPSVSDINSYANALLKSLSSLEYKVTFNHGYCPVTIGDCVRLNYSLAGLDGVKAKIIQQNISCQTGCTVSSTAVFSKELWEG